MTRRLIDLDGIVVPYAADDSPPLGARLRALVGAHLVDELTGLPPTGPITLRADVAGSPRVAPGGIVGVAGIPSEVFPRLEAQNYEVNITVSAERFVPRQIKLDVPAQPTFPATYTLPPILDFPVHRQPVVIEGRVVRPVGGTTVPLPGATVSVTGVWRQAPSATALTPPDPPDLVGLGQRLQLARSPATGTLTPLPLTPVGGDLRSLLDDVPVGARRLRVSNALGVALGTTVGIDADDGDRIEYGEVVGVEAASTPDQPAWFTLALPVTGAHRLGSSVRRMTAGAAGAVRALAREALAGDAVLFVANLTGLPSGTTVQIADGAKPVEYHQVQRFVAVTDAEGYYRMPPLSRVAQLIVRAQSGALTPVDLELRPDYTQASERLDFFVT